MPLIVLLAVLLLAALCYILFVLAQILFSAFGRSLGHGRDAGRLACAREEQRQSAGAPGGVFTAGFRKVHLSTFGAFVLVYGLLSWAIWGGYYHTFKAIWMTVCGPFTTAMLDPTPEHWKTAWGLFSVCAVFLLWGILCQLVRLPFQRYPRQVALLMWAIGLMVWFDAAILSYVMAA